MKKALSLVLAFVLIAALAVPSLAVVYTYKEGDDYEPGDLVYVSPQVPVGRIDNPLSAVATVVPSVAAPKADIYYQVQPDDTLELIAMMFYGRSNLASALYNANKNGHFAAHGFLAAYEALRIPGTLNGVSRLDNPLLHPTQQVNGQTYLLYQVKSGDTLSSIAQKYYNSRNFVNNIFAANKNLGNMTNANVIYVGQYILLPIVQVGF